MNAAANATNSAVKAEKKSRPANEANYKRAIVLGKKLMKNPEMTKAEATRQMYQHLNEEDREVIAQAFVEGANMTPKGAMTYVYNARRKAKKK